MTDFFLTITPTDGDIDELGHVNNAVWVRWIQEVATAHWQSVAAAAHLDAFVWMVTRHEIDYLGNVRSGDPVTARTWISDHPKGARFDRNMEFETADGKVIVCAKTTWVLIEKASGKVRRVPPEVSQPFFG